MSGCRNPGAALQSAIGKKEMHLVTSCVMRMNAVCILRQFCYLHSLKRFGCKSFFFAVMYNSTNSYISKSINRFDIGINSGIDSLSTI